MTACNCSYDQKKYESLARRIIAEQAEKTRLHKQARNDLWRVVLSSLAIYGLIIGMIWLCVLMIPKTAQAQVIPTPTITEASYYTVKSCLREGTSGIMANGRKLDDNSLVCASWDYSFGTRLLVTNIRNSKSIVVTVSDRGPSKRLYKKGRKLDLSRRAFASIANLKSGVIQVSVERAK